MSLARLMPTHSLRTTALSLSLLAGLGLSGCLGGGDGNGGDGGAGAGGGGGGGGGAGGSGGEFGTGNTPPEQFYRQIAELACDTYYRCCPNGIGGSDPLGGRANCIGVVTSLAGESTGEALATGKVVYNASAGNSCINVVRQRLSSAACGGAPLPDLRGDPAFAVCIEAFVGQVEAGGSCVISDDEQGFTTSTDIVCAPGLACFSPPGAGFSDQTCNAPVGEGEGCSDTDGCVVGLYCPFGGGEPVCTAKAANGAQCDDDEGCTSDHCDTDATPSVCIAPPAPGAACGAEQKRARAPLARFKMLRHIPGLRSLTGG